MKADEKDTIAKSRKISASQLNNLEEQIQFNRNRKEFLTMLNTSVQQILLSETGVKQALSQAAKNWEQLVRE